MKRDIKCPHCEQLISLDIGFPDKPWLPMVHPSQLPDGPERAAWIQAESWYMPRDIPPAVPGIAPVLPKLGVMAWIHRLCARMM